MYFRIWKWIVLSLQVIHFLWNRTISFSEGSLKEMLRFIINQRASTALFPIYFFFLLRSVLMLEFLFIFYICVLLAVKSYFITLALMYFYTVFSLIHSCTETDKAEYVCINQKEENETKKIIKSRCIKDSYFSSSKIKSTFFLFLSFSFLFCLSSSFPYFLFCLSFSFFLFSYSL